MIDGISILAGAGLQSSQLAGTEVEISNEDENEKQKQELATFVEQIVMLTDEEKEQLIIVKALEHNSPLASVKSPLLVWSIIGFFVALVGGLGGYIVFTATGLLATNPVLSGWVTGLSASGIIWGIIAGAVHYLISPNGFRKSKKLKAKIKALGWTEYYSGFGENAEVHYAPKRIIDYLNAQRITLEQELGIVDKIINEPKGQELFTVKN